MTSFVAMMLIALPIGSGEGVVINPHTPERYKKEIKVAAVYTFEVTAYTAGAKSTGKRPGDPGYGVTASGARAKEGRTIACPKRFSFGTKIYIPELKNTFVCEDRGGAIRGDRLDIYFESVSEARKFGRKNMKVMIKSQIGSKVDDCAGHPK